MVPPPVRAIFDTLIDRGTPLAASPFGAPLLGVKCGCNDAFLVVRSREGRADIGRSADARAPHRRKRAASVRTPGDVPLVRVHAAGRGAASRYGKVEASMLRPLVRGETLDQWRAVAEEWIVWTHTSTPAGGSGPLPALPPHAAAWLSPWRHRLATRTDIRGAEPWWTLHRTESADATRARVVWADFGRSPRALVLAAGDPTVALNTCYVARAPSIADAHALAALLNGPVAAAWLNVLAEPAQGGYRRYLGWTVALLPLPRDWARARALLAPLAERALAGVAIADADLRRAALAAYDLPADAVKPLLSWAAT
jgi:hypothetical protein